MRRFHARLDAFLDRLGTGPHISVDCAGGIHQGCDGCSCHCHELSDGALSPSSEPTTKGDGVPDPATVPVAGDGPTEAGYLGRSIRTYLDAVEERNLELLAATTSYRDVAALASAEDVPNLLQAIRTALALHPRTVIYTSGSTDPEHVPGQRAICGLCRDSWPCSTVHALNPGGRS